MNAGNKSSWWEELPSDQETANVMLMLRESKDKDLSESISKHVKEIKVSGRANVGFTTDKSFFTEWNALSDETTAFVDENSDECSTVWDYQGFWLHLPISSKQSTARDDSRTNFFIIFIINLDFEAKNLQMTPNL